MDDLVKIVKQHFKTKYVIIDNFMCRLHYKATFAILVMFSILVTAKQYFGEPIDCVIPKDTLKQDLLNTYCWIHRTFSVKSAFRKKLGEEVPYPGVAPSSPDGEDRVYHSYYQWVCFVLFIQALFFYLPRYLWKIVEDQRVKHLTSDLACPALANKKGRQEAIDLLVNYMDANRTHHRYYFFSFALIEIFYFINVIVQIYIMDVFLGGAFSSYGWRVATFTQWHWETRYDPMIEVFPRMAKCTFKAFGSSGDINTYDAICVLPINILNEKLYVFLWFWFVLLAAFTGLFLIYRSFTILSKNLRYKIIVYRNPTLEINSILSRIVATSDVGDWFFFYQVSKNIDSYNMKEFMLKYAAKIGIPSAKEYVEQFYPEKEN